MKKSLTGLLLTAAALAGGLSGAWLYRYLTPPHQAPEVQITVKNADELQTAFTAAIRKAMPAVVLVTAKKRMGFVEWHAFRRHIDYREIPSGQGSGFFIRPDGYLLTNYHVVRDQDSFWVTTSDGREYQARVAGSDPATDLAVLKVEGGPFPALAFADQETLQPGHWSIAIGAPFSLSQTVTVGIVSNKLRSGVGVNALESYVQTDAAINPGNSGGPLLNIRGEVIGVNDFILSPSGGNIGLSFAISGDLAGKISAELISKGFIERPWLGVLVSAIPPEMRKANGLRSGIAVQAVARHSPAADSLDPGDIILKADHQELRSPHDLQKIVLNSGAGKALHLEIRRGNRILSGTLTLQPSPRNWFRKMGGNHGALPVAL